MDQRHPDYGMRARTLTVMFVACILFWAGVVFLVRRVLVGG